MAAGPVGARGAEGCALGAADGELREDGRDGAAEGAGTSDLDDRVEGDGAWGDCAAGGVAERVAASRVDARVVAGVACAFAGGAPLRVGVDELIVESESGPAPGVGAAGGADGAPGTAASAPSIPRRVRLVVEAGGADGFGALLDPPRLCAGFGSEIEKTCDGAFACVTGTVVIFTRGANGLAGFFGGVGGAPSPSAGCCGSDGAGLFGSEDTRYHEMRITLIDDK